jgi:hypothetical protein
MVIFVNPTNANEQERLIASMDKKIIEKTAPYVCRLLW